MAEPSCLLDYTFTDKVKMIGASLRPQQVSGLLQQQQNNNSVCRRFSITPGFICMLFTPSLPASCCHGGVLLCYQVLFFSFTVINFSFILHFGAKEVLLLMELFFSCARTRDTVVFLSELNQIGWRTRCFYF